MVKPMTPGGTYTLAKLDFLGASWRGEEAHAIGVNRRHCRPLHPHGMRMVRDGLMKLGRDGGGRSRYCNLTITPDGIKELARLQKRQASRQRKYAHTPDPGPGPASRKGSSSFAAIFWSKQKQQPIKPSSQRLHE